MDSQEERDRWENNRSQAYKLMEDQLQHTAELIETFLKYGMISDDTSDYVAGAMRLSLKMMDFSDNGEFNEFMDWVGWLALYPPGSEEDSDPDPNLAEYPSDSPGALLWDAVYGGEVK